MEWNVLSLRKNEGNKMKKDPVLNMDASLVKVSCMSSFPALSYISFICLTFSYRHKSGAPH